MRPARELASATATLVITFIVLTAGGCMNPSMPSDLVMNLPPSPRFETLETEKRKLVVLQHGLWRSSGAMWRLSRSLNAHGYEVLNTSYPSTNDTIERHAERLARNIEKHLASVEQPYDEVWFVGHSLGGLVIRTYLLSDHARAGTGVIFLATPQRGATLAELDHEAWWYGLLLGTKAARQLRLSDRFHAELAARGEIPGEHIGVLFGGKGDERGWNTRIPGDDDGTVGAAEVDLEEATATKRLPFRHTRLGFSALMIHEVLHFLKHGTFREG